MEEDSAGNIFVEIRAKCNKPQVSGYNMVEYFFKKVEWLWRNTLPLSRYAVEPVIFSNWFRGVEKINFDIFLTGFFYISFSAVSETGEDLFLVLFQIENVAEELRRRGSVRQEAFPASQFNMFPGFFFAVCDHPIKDVSKGDTSIDYGFTIIGEGKGNASFSRQNAVYFH